MNDVAHMPPATPANGWHLDPPYRARSVLIVALVFLALAYTGSRVEIGRMLRLSGEAVLDLVGLREQSQVGDGLAKIGTSLFPIVLAERTPLARIENFDAAKLPWLAHVETELFHEQRQVGGFSDQCAQVLDPRHPAERRRGQRVVRHEPCLDGRIVPPHLEQPVGLHRLSTQNRERRRHHCHAQRFLAEVHATGGAKCAPAITAVSLTYAWPAAVMSAAPTTRTEVRHSPGNSPDCLNGHRPRPWRCCRPRAR